jgi:hypothetical protein
MNQRSASSASTISKLSPYSTPEQTAMRMRFLYTTFQDASDPLKEKSSVTYYDSFPHMTEEHVAKRKEVDEEVCYVTLENWRTTQLGIGLLVRPRTARERYRKLIPRVELVEDYLSADAYNRT